MGSWAYFDPEYETLSIRINPPQFSSKTSAFLLLKLNVVFVSIRYDHRFEN